MLHPKIKVFWNDMSIANAGVVFREAKEEKAVPVCNGKSLILFLFRLSFTSLLCVRSLYPYKILYTCV